MDGARRPDGTRRAGTPITYRGATCAQVTREATVAAVGFIPLELHAGPAAAPAPAAQTAESAGGCDEPAARRREEDARREGHRQGYSEGVRAGREAGRVEGRNEREEEMQEEIREAVRRELRRRGLPPGGWPDDRERMPYPFAVSVGGIVSLGFALDVAPGFAIGGEWRPVDLFSLGVEARYIAPAAIAEFGKAPGVEPIKYPVSIVSALVAPCLRWKIVVGCGAADLGALYFDKGGDDPDVWFERVAVGPRLGVDIPFLERFSARVMGDVLFPLVGVRLPNLRDGRVSKTPDVSGFVTAGLTVGF